MSTRREYSDEIKAQVMAALLAGQSVSAVAREYSLPKGTVSSWRKAALRELDGGAVENESTQKGSELGDLVLAYLRENLITLRAQAVHFRDPKWLSRQDASELAVLHGVVTDKAIRLLEAIDAGNE
jgi:transposase-like protein